jgi:hypothetical protein
MGGDEATLGRWQGGGQRGGSRPARRHRGLVPGHGRPSRPARIPDGFDLLPRGHPAVQRCREGSFAHPLAFRLHRQRQRAARNPREPAGLWQLPLVLGGRQGAGHGCRLWERQGRLCPDQGRQGDDPGHQRRHLVERLPARPGYANLWPAFSGLTRRPIRGEHSEGSLGVRARPDLAFSQLFFPIQGILAVYDSATKTFSSLPGADDAAFVQSNPAWSPDGKFIVFARSRAHELSEPSRQTEGAAHARGLRGVRRRPHPLQVRPVPYPVQRWQRGPWPSRWRARRKTA